MSLTLTIPAEAQARAAADADVTVRLPGDVPMYFRRIPAAPQGFLMGERREESSEPIHRVIISRDFWMGTFPVTQAQYRAVAASWLDATLDSDPSHFKGDLRPVEQVSWDDAIAWCAAVTQHWSDLSVRTRDGAPFILERFGLASEAQWEYACRGRSWQDGGLWSRTEFHTGDGEARLSEAGWFSGNSKDEALAVGRKAANGFGLYDMHGHVWEWCEDVWDARAYRKRKDGWEARSWTLEDAGSDAMRYGEPFTSGQDSDLLIRVERGGSCYNTAGRCRSAFREGGGPGNRFRDLGFRVCLVHSPAEPLQPLSPARAERSFGSTRQRSAAEGSRG